MAVKRPTNFREIAKNRSTVNCFSLKFHKCSRPTGRPLFRGHFRFFLYNNTSISWRVTRPLRSVTFPLSYVVLNRKCKKYPFFLIKYIRKNNSNAPEIGSLPEHNLAVLLVDFDNYRFNFRFYTLKHM